MLPSSLNPWRRDLAALLRLSGPVAATRIGVMAMGLTDAVVVGRYSAEQLGDQAMAWTLPGTALVGAMGFLSGVQVMTARAMGQGRPDLTGAVLKRGLRYALGLGVAMALLLLLFGPMILGAFHLAPGLAQGAAPALRVFALSLPGALVATCAGYYLEAIGKPAVNMAAMWGANLVNLAVDLALVPGRLGLPALGAAGAAWGTFTARAALAVFLVVYVFRMRGAGDLGLLDRAGDSGAFAVQQRRLGYGAGTSQLVEAAGFSGMSLVAGWVGALTVASWAVMVNVSAIVFMVPLGLSIASAVLVGRTHGAGDTGGASRAAVLGCGVAAAYGLLLLLATLAFRRAIAAAYSPDPALIRLASQGLALSALFFIPDAVQVVAAQVLRAQGDVLTPTLTHIASYAVVMPLTAWVLAIGMGMGLTGIVLAVIVASLLSAGLLAGRLWMLPRRGGRRDSSGVRA